MSDVHPFKVVSNFQPAGDQPNAITALVDGIEEGLEPSDVVGCDWVGGKPSRLLRSLSRFSARQLFLHLIRRSPLNFMVSLKIFFPHNSVEYFVSYYDYYQPEAYVAASDTYIEKDSSINAHIEQMRIVCN